MKKEEASKKVIMPAYESYELAKQLLVRHDHAETAARTMCWQCCPEARRIR